MAELKLNKQFTPRYGEAVVLAPWLRRVVAHNPGPFTFYGTGTYIIGRGDVAVIDPGPVLPEHLDAILAATAGERITHILITHTHSDHSPLAALLQQRTGAGIYAWPRSANTMDNALEAAEDDAFMADIWLQQGDQINAADWRLQAMHTPGHCANHVAFAEPEREVLFCGDHAMAWSTTVIIPPAGSLQAYLNSCEAILARGFKTLYPTHGEPIDDPAVFINALMQHRRLRLQQIKQALGAQGLACSDLCQRFYSDVPASLHYAAETSIWASLLCLLERGEAQSDDVAGMQSLFSAAK